MKTVYDLEAELKRLRSRVRQLEGVAAPSQDNVSAIVEPSADDQIQGGGGETRIEHGARGGGVPAHKMSNGVQHVGHVPSDAGKFDQNHGIALGASSKDDGE